MTWFVQKLDFHCSKLHDKNYLKMLLEVEKRFKSYIYFCISTRIYWTGMFQVICSRFGPFPKILYFFRKICIRVDAPQNSTPHRIYISIYFSIVCSWNTHDNLQASITITNFIVNTSWYTKGRNFKVLKFKMEFLFKISSFTIIWRDLRIKTLK